MTAAVFDFVAINARVRQLTGKHVPNTGTTHDYFDNVPCRLPMPKKKTGMVTVKVSADVAAVRAEFDRLLAMNNLLSLSSVQRAQLTRDQQLELLGLPDVCGLTRVVPGQGAGKHDKYVRTSQLLDEQAERANRFFSDFAASGVRKNAGY